MHHLFDFAKLSERHLESFCTDDSRTIFYFAFGTASGNGVVSRFSSCSIGSPVAVIVSELYGSIHLILAESV